jgi:cob(I)alamin adenosyltransferase
MGEYRYYTGVGDGGDTARLGGQGRLSKNCILMNVLGDLDEATCAIGMVRAVANEPLLKTEIPIVQRHLYTLMAHLYALPEMRELYTGLLVDELTELEDLIARLSEGVPYPQDFVLPGDSESGAACHIARAIVRRAERHLVAFAELETGIGATNLAYVNRLSSLMFVAALREDMLLINFH